MSGTWKWCPECKALHYVKVVPPDWRSIHFGSVRRNFNYSNCGDPIHFFKRKMKCMDCGTKWYSAEFKLTDLKDLIETNEGLRADVELMQEDLDSQRKEIGSLKTSLSIAVDGNKSRDGIIETLKSRIESYSKTIELFKDSQIELTLEYEEKRGELRELKDALKVIMKHVETEEV